MQCKTTASSATVELWVGNSTKFGNAVERVKDKRWGQTHSLKSFWSSVFVVGGLFLLDGCCCCCCFSASPLLSLISLSTSTTSPTSKLTFNLLRSFFVVVVVALPPTYLIEWHPPFANAIFYGFYSKPKI